MIGIQLLVSFETEIHVGFNVLGNAFVRRRQGFEHREVVLFPFDRFREKADPFVFGCDDKVLSRVPFLFPRIVSLLLILVFRPLDRPLGAVDEDLPGFGKGGEEILDALHPPFGKGHLFPQGFLHNVA